MSWKRPNVLERMKPLLQNIPERSTGYWIDIGSGDGVFAKLLTKRFQNEKIIQTDIRSYEKVTGLHFLADLKSLPIRKNCFDGIICAQVLHYIPLDKLYKIIRQLVDKLILGGKLLIIEYVKGKKYPWVPHPFSESDIVALTKNDPNISYHSTTYDYDKHRPKYGIIMSRNI